MYHVPFLGHSPPQGRHMNKEIASIFISQMHIRLFMLHMHIRLFMLEMHIRLFMLQMHIRRATICPDFMHVITQAKMLLYILVTFTSIKACLCKLWNKSAYTRSLRGDLVTQT